MKAKTINSIRDMLIKQKESAHRDYKTLRQKLEQKYETEWLIGILTDYEKRAITDLKEEYDKAREIFEDFEQHQW